MHQINQEKINQAIKSLKEQNIDMWIIFSAEGSDPALPLVVGVKTVGKTFFIFTKEGEKIALCSNIDAQESEQSGLFDKVIKYDDPAVILKEMVEHFDPKTIALNYSVEDNLCDGLTVGKMRWLESALGEDLSKRFVSSDSFLPQLRSIKTEGEIELLKKAIDITTDIYNCVFDQLKVGMTEYEVGQLFVKEMEKRDVVNGNSKKLDMPMVLKERLAHRGPGDAVIEPGDFLVMDVSVDYQGYVSDIARTVYFLKEGETQAPPEVQDTFDAIHSAISAAFEAMKPGMKGYEIDGIARQHLLDHGMPEITHATGHQIGRATHDGGTLLGPRWARYGRAPYMEIETGMVFTLEPTVLRPDGGFSAIVEENLVMTEKGAQYLSRRQDELIVIGGERHV